jgi:hypothetical protein
MQYHFTLTNTSTTKSTLFMSGINVLTRKNIPKPKLENSNIDNQYENTTDINEIESAPKFLGITLDPKLSFKLHFEKVENEMQKRLNKVKILKSEFWSSTPDFCLTFMNLL